VIVDLDKYRKSLEPPLTDDDVWALIDTLAEKEMILITKQNGTLRVAKVKASWFAINPEEF
jgi:hypothetical protein